jgi:multiple antibiotic resistance protein
MEFGDSTPLIPGAALASLLAALFSMMNPIGGVGVFAGMTADRPRNQARRIAWACWPTG